MSPIKIVFADDHPLVRAGIRSVIESSIEIKIVAEFDNGKSLIEALPYFEPDVIVLDVEMPILSGIDTIKALKQKGDLTPILILSAYADELYVKETFALGISGYLLKSEISHRIIEAIKAIASGKSGWVSPAVEKVLLKPTPTNEHSVLTDRENDILKEVQEGKTNKEIADTLIISEHTVKNHLSHIFKKLGIKHRHQAIRGKP